jgi:hypothetical protein
MSIPHFINTFAFCLIKLEDAVYAKEFCEAVKVLVAFAAKHIDEIPNRWSCDEDCKRIFEDICPGEFGIDKNSKNMCPFFIDDGMV